MRTFDQIFETRADSAYSLCQRLEAGEERADALFLDLWRRLYRTMVQVAGQNEEKWLCRHLIEAHRQLNRRHPVGPSETVEGDPKSALMNLKSEYRWPIVLHEFASLSYSDVADVLGVPERNVRQRLARARMMLRKSMAGWSTDADIDEEALSAYVDNELTSEERRAVGTLVTTDSTWNEAFEGIKSDAALLKKAPTKELAEALKQRAKSLALTDMEAGAERRRVPRFKRRWMLLAAMVIPTVFTLLFFQNPNSTARVYLKKDHRLELQAGRSIVEQEFVGSYEWHSPSLWGAFHPEGEVGLSYQLDTKEKTVQTVQAVVEYDFDGDGEVDRREVYEKSELDLRIGWERFTPKLTEATGEFAPLVSGVIRVTLMSDSGGTIRASGTPGELIVPYRGLRGAKGAVKQ